MYVGNPVAWEVGGVELIFLFAEKIVAFRILFPYARPFIQS
jgi:hypothetical protein